jgi:hypothetical protein
MDTTDAPSPMIAASEVQDPADVAAIGAACALVAPTTAPTASSGVQDSAGDASGPPSTNVNVTPIAEPTTTTPSAVQHSAGGAVAVRPSPWMGRAESALAAAPTEPAEISPSTASTASEILDSTEMSSSAAAVPTAMMTSDVSSGVQHSAVGTDESVAEKLARIIEERTAANGRVTADWIAETRTIREEKRLTTQDALVAVSDFSIHATVYLENSGTYMPSDDVRDLIFLLRALEKRNDFAQQEVFEV